MGNIKTHGDDQNKIIMSNKNELLICNKMQRKKYIAYIDK